ncbi:peroxidase-related enzyme [Pseudonocardia sp.]|uniref:peroxidase-related enzyme n=1 Tax=Pseudonocardia sp. TaxID=60912 RepID=UPI003D0D7CFF
MSDDGHGRETSWFPVPPVSDLSASLQSLCGKAEEQLGFVPNVFRGYAHRPERFSAWFAHYSQLHVPTDNLSAADREMIAVVVSAIHSCTYCLTSHLHALREALGDVVKADLILHNWRHAGLDERELAICRYADKLTREPATISREDLDTLAKVGLSEDEVWDVAELTAMYSFTNRLALAMGFVPNTEYHHLARTAAADAAVS